MLHFYAPIGALVIQCGLYTFPQKVSNNNIGKAKVPKQPFFGIHVFSRRERSIEHEPYHPVDKPAADQLQLRARPRLLQAVGPGDRRPARRHLQD